jgi:hypothetical protein
MFVSPTAILSPRRGAKQYRQMIMHRPIEVVSQCADGAPPRSHP